MVDAIARDIKILPAGLFQRKRQWPPGFPEMKLRRSQARPGWNVHKEPFNFADPESPAALSRRHVSVRDAHAVLFWENEFVSCNRLSPELDVVIMFGLRSHPLRRPGSRTGLAGSASCRGGARKKVSPEARGQN